MCHLLAGGKLLTEASGHGVAQGLCSAGNSPLRAATSVRGPDSSRGMQHNSRPTYLSLCTPGLDGVCSCLACIDHTSSVQSRFSQVMTAAVLMLLSLWQQLLGQLKLLQEPMPMESCPGLPLMVSVPLQINLYAQLHRFGVYPNNQTAYGTPRHFRALIANIATSNNTALQKMNGTLTFLANSGQDLCNGTLNNNGTMSGMQVGSL